MLSLSFLTGCAQAFGGPAYQALIPSLVDRRDLVNAITLNSIQFNLARVVGPAIGSIPFALISSVMVAGAVSFAINGLSFVAVIIALSLLHLGSMPRTEEQVNHWRTDLRGGLNFVIHDEALRSLTLLSFASAFFGTQFLTFLPVFAETVHHTGPSGYSTLLSTSGAGAVLGALIIAGTGDDIKNKGRAALIMQVVFGLMIIAFASTSLVWLGYLLVFVAGVSMMMFFALIQSLVQMTVADAMRGRVMSIYMVAFRGGMPLGALVTGWLAEHFSIARVIAVEGAMLVAMAIGYLASGSKVKEH